VSHLRDHLTRFWFEFEGRADALPGARLGCGVTAVSREDAEQRIRGGFERGLPPVSRVIEDVDVATLDEGHVLPTMGDVSVRGIWFPRGFPGPAEERRGWSG
jgi:hypothetical protein